MRRRHILRLLLAVLSLHSALSEGNCFWVEGLDWCTGTNDGPYGQRWAFLAAAMIYCVRNTIRTNEQALGCGPDTDATICKIQTFDYLPEGQKECSPLASDFPSSRVPDPDCLAVSNTPACVQDRLEVATGMGCPECIEAFNEGHEVQPICLTGWEGKSRCREVNPGSSFGSGPFPDKLRTNGCGVRQMWFTSSSPCTLPGHMGVLILVLCSVLATADYWAELFE